MSTILKYFDESKTLYKGCYTFPITTNIRFINTTLSVSSKRESDSGKDKDDWSTDSDSSSSSSTDSKDSSGSSTSDEEEEALSVKVREREICKRASGGEGLSSKRLPDLTSLIKKLSEGKHIILNALTRSKKKKKSEDKSSEPPQPQPPPPCKEAEEEDSDVDLESEYSATNSTGLKMAGDYPAEYNAAVHGPYDPSRFYGKPDTPLGQVKISELGSWISRRNKSPKAIVAAFSRAYWRWQLKYMLPKRATVAPVLQFASFAMVASYFLNYYKIKHHYYYKYH